MSNLRVEFPLGPLSKEDATARLTALGAYLTSKHGIQVTWNGDSATVRGKYLVVGIEGTLKFEGAKAVFDGKDPGFLWRGKAKDYLANKLSVYLNPATKLEDLPRSG
jgi:hypothetical protein